MCEHYRLCTLQVRIAWKNGISKSLGNIDDRHLQFPDQAGRGVDFASKPEPKCGRYLIVSATARVDLSAGIAYRLYQFAFDERVYIFGVGIKEVRIYRGIGLQLA